MDIDQSLGLKRDTLIDRLSLSITAGIFLIGIGLVSLQVVLRLVDVPVTLAWTEPASRLTLVIGTYFGAAVASRNNEHISMEIVLQKLEEKHPRVKLIFDIVVHFTIIITLVIVVVGLYQGAQGAWNSNWADIDPVSTGMIYFGIALGLTWMLGYEFFELKRSLSAITFDQLMPQKTNKSND